MNAQIVSTGSKQLLKQAIDGAYKLALRVYPCHGCMCGRCVAIADRQPTSCLHCDLVGLLADASTTIDMISQAERANEAP